MSRSRTDVRRLTPDLVQHRPEPRVSRVATTRRVPPEGLDEPDGLEGQSEGRNLGQAGEPLDQMALKPRRCAARVTPRSASKASRASSRLRSRLLGLAVTAPDHKYQLC